MISLKSGTANYLACVLLDLSRIFIPPEGRSRRRIGVPPWLPAPFFWSGARRQWLRWPLVVLVLGVSAPGFAREPPPPPGHSVLLPAEQGTPLVQQCSRAVPRITATWSPTGRDVRRLEADLRHLKGQRAAACCSQKAQMDDALKYYRQYAGVVRGGRRLIYVNAFLNPPGPGPDAVDWKQKPVIACGGGVDNWGVLYDPESRTFAQLAFNGDG